MSKKEPCPFCEQSASIRIDFETNVVRYECTCCGEIQLERNDNADWSDSGRRKSHPKRICALLVERRLQGLPSPFLLFRDRNDYSIDRSTALHIDDLLSEWPQTIPERIERSFCCLLRPRDTELHAGQDISVYRKTWRDSVPFALDVHELVYFLDALQQYGWIRYSPAIHYFAVSVLPSGWEKYHELMGSRADVRNPVFVAMWFGKKPGDDRSGDMNKLYAEGIEPACRKAGWDVARADSQEHNEPVMGKILEGIRKAPFVIAELTDDNSGVLYEAGFALGQGKEVIYCKHTDQDVHFDVRAINQVVWKDNEDLAKRLYDRILETQREGPFVKRGPEGAN